MKELTRLKCSRSILVSEKGPNIPSAVHLSCREKGYPNVYPRFRNYLTPVMTTDPQMGSPPKLFMRALAAVAFPQVSAIYDK